MQLAKQASCNDAVRPNPPVQIGEVISDHILWPSLPQVPTPLTSLRHSGPLPTKVVPLTGYKILPFSTQQATLAENTNLPLVLIRYPAVGRVTRVQGYGQEELGIPTQCTVAVNDYLETLYDNIDAAGDVAGPYQSPTRRHTWLGMRR